MALRLKQVPPEEWFSAAIDEGLKRMREHRSDPGWFHPSDAPNACARYHQLAFIGAPGQDKASPELTFMALVGTYIHTLIQKAVGEHEAVFDIEGKLEDGVTRVRGSNDMRILDYDGVLAILDIKSCNALPAEPKPDHVLQLAWYCYLAGATRAVLQYITRGNGAKRRFTLAWHEMRAIWEASRDQLAGVLALTKDGVLAPRTPALKADCLSCPFEHFCDETEKGDESWLELRTSTLRLLSPHSM